MSAERATDPRGPGLTLSGAAAIFWRRLSPRILAAMILAAAVCRVVLGDPTVWDAVVAAAIVAIHPLTEWAIHVYLLHFKPRTLWGRRIDLRLARDHRSHHRAPHDARYWFIPVPSALTGFAFTSLLAYLVMPTLGLAATAVLTMAALGLVYEWTHFLCHCSMRPRTNLMRRLKRHHRLHHFKNERFWLGVTMLGGDRLLGTLPDPADVEASPTCRALHDG